MLAAAQNARCAVVYSEDFNSGQRYGGLLVRTPPGTGRAEGLHVSSQRVSRLTVKGRHW